MASQIFFRYKYLDIPGPAIVAVNAEANAATKQFHNTSNKISYWNGLYLIPILFLCVLFSLPLILVPQNDDIKLWKKRNDVSSVIGDMINYAFGFSLLQTFHLMSEFKMIFKIHSMMTFQTFTWVYMLNLLTFIILPILTAHLVWNVALGHASVMPFNLLLFSIWLPFCYIILWVYYTKHICENKKGRQKFKAYMYYKCWLFIYSFLRFMISAIFKILPSECQWVMAIVLPLNRELDHQVSKTLLSKGPGLLDESTKTLVVIRVNSLYSMHVALAIGHRATTFTSCCILIVDLMFNLQSAYKILRLTCKIEPDHLENQKRLIKKKEELRKLCLVEVIEIVVPITYITTYLIAYHGPNAELFRGMLDRDVVTLVVPVMWMFLIDLSSGILGSILLVTCSINLLREGCGVLKTYGPMIALQIARQLYIVSFENFRYFMYIAIFY